MSHDFWIGYLVGAGVASLIGPFVTAWISRPRFCLRPDKDDRR